MRNNLKKWMLTGSVIAVLSGALVYSNWNQAAFAAEGSHGHVHEEDENGHDDHSEHDGGDDHEEGALQLSSDQMAAAGITTIAVRQGTLSHQVSVPGRIVADADRMAQIVPKVSGIVIEARKNIGDAVKKGDVLAVIESREMAESAAEYQAASRSAELARTTHRREKALWEKKITAEQDFLAAKNAWQEAQIRLDLATQKMETLGGTSDTGTPSRYHELQSPLDGLIVERDLVLGEFVDTAKKAFTVADLSVLWVEIAIAPNDLGSIKEGQDAYVEGGGRHGTGKLIFVSPVINVDTRTAKAIIELPNPDGSWRSGDYAAASILTTAQNAGMLIPKDSIQMMDGNPFVFVKTPTGFEKRRVTIGQQDNRQIEVISGLTAGEDIAKGNTFVLKAEAGKSEAEHSH